MGTANQTVVNLVSVGGNPPYIYSVIQGTSTTITASISNGNVLLVDATSVNPGFYSVLIQIQDALGNQTQETVPVQVVSPNTFAVLNEDAAYEPVNFPFTVNLPLVQVGGSGTVSWTLIPNVTTLPGASISGSTLNFTTSAFGEWTVGLRAIDSVANNATKLIEVAIVTPTVTSLVDGQVEIKVTPPINALGTQQFSLQAIDSAANVVSQQFAYSVANQVSEIEVAEAAIDYVWGANDTTEIVYPIQGSLLGFTLGPNTQVIAANGLTVAIDAANNAITVTGPPTSFQTAEVDASLVVLRSANQVALVTREFTLIAHNGTTDLGTMVCNTRPYITGEVVGLNPLRPYFNSPTFSRNQLYTVELVPGQTLPPGLSLDSVSGQIYGTLAVTPLQALAQQSSTLQYLDAADVVHGTVTVVWDLCPSGFVLLDQVPSGQVQAAFSGTIGSSSSAPLTTAVVHRGTLPQGMTLGIDSGAQNVVLGGIPVEAGYFDLWIQVSNSIGQLGTIHKRLVIDYIPPLVILTELFPQLTTNQPYTRTLTAFGGVAPYGWSILLGTLPSGVTLDPASGIVAGTPTQATYSSPITFAVTDQRGVVSSAVLTLTINNTLTISTTVLPIVTPGVAYSYQLNAQGGTPPYTWALGTGSGNLPGGFTLAPSGILSGATSLSSYSATLVVQATDSASTSVTRNETLLVAAQSGLAIDTEGIGPIVRGAPYQGLLRVTGPGVAPYKWSVVPSSTLPAGLRLANGIADQGASATISGTTAAVLDNDSVQVQVVDNNGNSATVFILFATYSSLAITTTSVPQGTVGGTYSVQLQASGVNTPFSWVLASGNLPPGQTLSSAGVISGVPQAQGNYPFQVTVTDSLGDTATGSLTEVTMTSTLAFVTTSIPAITAGVPYHADITVTGGQTPYQYGISPLSTAGYPPGIGFTTIGNFIGTSYAVGYTGNVTIRVTDNLGVYRDETLAFSVTSTLALTAGPDYNFGPRSTRSLGMVGSGDLIGISPRSNFTFYVIATGIISTQASQISASVPSGFSAVVDSIDNTNHVATIRFDGPFKYLPVGDNNFYMTVNDSGVLLSALFTWRVYIDQVVSIVAANFTPFPVLFTAS